MSKPTDPSQAPVFAGSIPETYDRLLGPMLFQPYAQDLARRLAAVLSGRPSPRILEVACGTGILTRELAATLPKASITPTDLNEPMLAVARRLAPPALRQDFRQADACHLPFPDRSFDAIACQFGFMFFPDKPSAMREARRVLAPGGASLFSVWDTLDSNPMSRVVHDLIAAALPSNPPDFFATGPFAWHDRGAIERLLREAGFASVRLDTVELPSEAPSADDAARALIDGTPLAAELAQRGVADTANLRRAAAAALARSFGDRPCRAPMRAVIATAM